jgi:hypothetical protein
VELPDSSGCISVSSLDTIHVNNPAPVVNIIPAAPAFCTAVMCKLRVQHLEIRICGITVRSRLQQQ